MNQTNGNEGIDGHQNQWIASFMEWINTSDVFYGGGGKKKLDVFFPAKKAIDERWEVVTYKCQKNTYKCQV